MSRSKAKAREGKTLQNPRKKTSVKPLKQTVPRAPHTFLEGINTSKANKNDRNIEDSWNPTRPSKISSL